MPPAAINGSRGTWSAAILLRGCAFGVFAPLSWLFTEACAAPACAQDRSCPRGAIEWRSMPRRLLRSMLRAPPAPGQASGLAEAAA
jgi:hypothetical protein